MNTKNHSHGLVCPICLEHKKKFEMFQGSSIRANLIPFIQKLNLDWKTTDAICSSCLRLARLELVEQMVLDEKGEIGTVEREVLNAIASQQLVTTQPSDDNRELTFGERLSDKFADIGGSWTFIICFTFVLFFWIFLNTAFLLKKPFDPYPYILLNLVLSCLAALQAPIIMMSQNRKENKDRIRAEADYKTNLKAELEIRHLNIKLDQLTTHQWNQLIEIQKVQLDVLEELSIKKK